MARGTIALIASLGVVSVAFILIVSSAVFVTGISRAEDRPDGLSFFQIAWMSLLRTFDPGTMGGDTGGPLFLFSMLVVTLGGIFLVSTLIGILTSGIEARIQELRKGRSFVVEQGHMLILGWSPQIFTVISELVEANANQPRSCIVVLADKDKVEMEDAIHAQVPSMRRTRLVCRSGSPLDLHDLDTVNPHGARSIIVLAPETDNPDTAVIKSLLALTNNPNRKLEPYHIVAEIRDAKNMDVARMVGRDEAQIVLIGDLISRITVQTCRQSGLSIVYTELLNFGGDEIYFHSEPALVGKTFGESLSRYEDSAVIGLQRKDDRTVLNPPMDTRIEQGDRIIAISEDDDTVEISGLTDFGIEQGAIQQPRPSQPLPERTLILGWNSRAPSIIRELDAYVAPGSETTVVANVPDLEAQVTSIPVGRQKVSCQTGDTTDRRTLDALDIPGFDHVIVLSYSDTLEAEQADSQTLVTLLHLRDMSEKTGKDFAIVSEMLDVRNRTLADVTRADDFIVSDQLVSLMLSQVSENKSLTGVFADLFDPEGSEIYLKPAENYVKPGVPLNFYTVLESARCRGEVAIGYRQHRHAHDAAQSYGVVVNPNKSEQMTFETGDNVIVLAES
ncbi:MAG: potassium transporter TrkA [Chloroflexi bacterium]|nr:potassium transporter TrkA [Chloroflexota bacterium]